MSRHDDEDERSPGSSLQKIVIKSQDNGNAEAGLLPSNRTQYMRVTFALLSLL